MILFRVLFQTVGLALSQFRFNWVRALLTTRLTCSGSAST